MKKLYFSTVRLLRKKTWASLLLCSVLLNTFSGMTAFAASFSTSSRSTIHGHYHPQNTYLSPVKKAPMEFTGLGIKWHQIVPEGTGIELFIRFQTHAGWGSWHSLESDIDGKTEQNQQYPTSFIATNLAHSFQYKIVLSTQDSKITPLIENIEFTYLNAKEAIGTEIEKSSFGQIPVTSMSSAEVRSPITATLGSSSVARFLSESSDDVKQQSTLIVADKNASSRSKNVKIISRKQWGADESLRYYKETQSDSSATEGVGSETSDNENAQPLDNETPKTVDPSELLLSKTVTTASSGETLTWPLEYSAKISKIIIHHTASVNNLDNPKQAIRDIYYWHTIKKGWGDIGYNYIIDPKGNIYEGRYGGEGVVGAHAANANTGSIGIAVMGNYEENDVPPAVVDSLVALIRLKTTTYGIDPTGSSKFRGQKLPNVMGHLDVRATSCPGKNLYKLLPTIREQVKGELKTNFIDKRRTADQKKYNYDLISKISTIEVEPGEQKNISITLKNTGNTSWGSETTLMVNNTDDSKNFFDGARTIRSNPIGKVVSPGDKATFTLSIRLKKYSGGFGSFEVFPFIDGSKKVEKYLSIPLKVTSPEYDYETVSVNVKKSNLKAGEETDVVVVLKNTGNIAWQRAGTNRMSLGTENPRDHYSQLLSRPATRLGRLKESEVKPGQKGTFLIKIKAPKFDGVYREYFGPVIEGVSWLPFKEKNSFEITVGKSGDKGDRNQTSFSPSKLNQEMKKDIRVDLSFRGEPVISSETVFTLFDGTKELAQFSANTPVRVTYSQNAYSVTTDKNYFNLQTPPRFRSEGGVMRIENFEHRPDWDVTLNDNEYRGVLEPHYYHNELHVINELRVEDYLKGLAEISAKDPSEKIKAVLIAARTYAYFYTTVSEKFPGAPFHLTDDPQKSQIYLGYGFEKRSPTGVKAVNGTRGLVVTFKGTIVKTPYFSADDGRTRSAKEVWGWNDTPYLVSVDDPGCIGKSMAGHGVGLSGCGAFYFAQQGKTAEQILQYYYPGTTLKQI